MIRIGSEIRGLILFTGILLLVFLTDITAVWYYYHRVLLFVDHQPARMQGDAAVIYFGDYINKGSELGIDSKKRAQKAVAFYKDKRIRKIICVGGYHYRHWKGKPHMMKRYLIENQVSAADILYDSASYNTITNLTEARKIIINWHFDTVINISSPLHIYRIADMIDLPNNYYASYSYNLITLHDYWMLYKDIHHEFVSQILNRILKDEIRNRLVLVYRYIESLFDKVF